MSTLLLTERGVKPATPSAGQWRAYFKAAGFFIIDDLGNEIGPFSGGGGGDHIVDDTNLGSAVRLVTLRHSASVGTPGDKFGGDCELQRDAGCGDDSRIDI